MYKENTMPLGKNHPFRIGGPVKCPMCGNKCKNKYGYIMHARRVHGLDETQALSKLQQSDSLKKDHENHITNKINEIGRQAANDRIEVKQATLLGGNKFKVGDVVCLNSGGPGMTVVNMGTETQNQENHVAYVVWFDEEDMMHEDEFPIECLEVEVESNE